MDWEKEQCLSRVCEICPATEQATVIIFASPLMEFCFCLPNHGGRKSQNPKEKRNEGWIIMLFLFVGLFLYRPKMCLLAFESTLVATFRIFAPAELSNQCAAGAKKRQALSRSNQHAFLRHISSMPRWTQVRGFWKRTFGTKHGPRALFSCAFLLENRDASTTESRTHNSHLTSQPFPHTLYTDTSFHAQQPGTSTRLHTCPSPARL